jgi:two-component system sensor histidine kinase UhpB
LAVTGLEQDRLDAQLETVLYRVIQEALTNVAKHAQANAVKLYLQRDNNTVQAVIEDDGCGFNLEEVINCGVSDSGTGLVGIQERVTLLGGDLNIQTEPEQGTRLSIEIPLGNY